MLLGREAECRDVLRGIFRVGRREAIGNGLEPEGGAAVEGGGAPGFQQTVVIVHCVYKGDVEAFGVEDFGEF